MPIAIIGVVCGRKQKTPLRVERRLVGETAVDFDPLSFEPRQRRCIQIRDLVPGETLGEGQFTYEVQVLEQQELLAEGRRDLFVESLVE